MECFLKILVSYKLKQEITQVFAKLLSDITHLLGWCYSLRSRIIQVRAFFLWKMINVDEFELLLNVGYETHISSNNLELLLEMAAVRAIWKMTGSTGSANAIYTQNWMSGWISTESSAPTHLRIINCRNICDRCIHMFWYIQKY